MSLLDSAIEKGKIVGADVSPYDESKPSANDYVIPGDVKPNRLTTALVINEITLLMSNTGNLNVEIQSLPDGKDVAARLQRIIDLANAIAKNAKRLQDANK